MASLERVGLSVWHYLIQDLHILLPLVWLWLFYRHWMSDLLSMLETILNSWFLMGAFYSGEVSWLHRLATCKMFHAFHPCLASTKRWLVVPPSDMLIVYKMNHWFCKNMIKIYSLQNACYLQNALPNITLTVQNSTLQSFCRQLKFSHSVGEIVRGMVLPKS